jgi:hypothetical protein
MGTLRGVKRPAGGGEPGTPGEHHHPGTPGCLRASLMLSPLGPGQVASWPWSRRVSLDTQGAWGSDALIDGERLVQMCSAFGGRLPAC